MQKSNNARIQTNKSITAVTGQQEKRVMNLKEAFTAFNTDKTVCILIKDKSGEKYAISEANFDGGVCGCCGELSLSDETEVIRVFDIETMEQFYPKA